MGSPPTLHGQEYRLIVISDGSARTIRLEGNRWTIGRSNDCNISLRDPTVSRLHLLIERKGDNFDFSDLGGANPVLLDGKAARQGPLKPGQEVTIGLTRLNLERSRRPAAVVTPASNTIILSREVLDEELSQETSPNNFTSAATRVLEQIEWTYADKGNLANTAEPLLELAINITQRKSGWLGQFPMQGNMDLLASAGGSAKLQLTQATIDEARRIRQPHILTTDEDGILRERLIMPLGSEGEAILILQDPYEGAPQGQDLLKIAQSLCNIVWHRLRESLENLRLREELERLRFRGTSAHNALLTSSRLQEAREQIRTDAHAFSNVTLIGEPGTEREYLARYLHTESNRRAKPFVSWDAAKASAEEQSIRLLGDGDQPTLIQHAAHGTLLIENLSALSNPLQRSLLASLQSLSEDNQPRLVVAEDNKAAVKSWTSEIQQHFHSLPILIPALREDPRDVLALAEIILSELGPCQDGSPRLMTERCKNLLTTHTWPGNVRELRLTLESAAVKAGNNLITPRHLKAALTYPISNSQSDIPTLESVERAHIAEVMLRAGGVRAKAAQILGIANSTLYDKIKKYKI